MLLDKTVHNDLQRLASLLSETQALIGVGAWELDAVTGRVLWTEEVYHLHGVDPEHFNPNLDDALSFYHPDDRPVIEEAVNKVAEFGIPYTITYRIVRPDGGLRHVKTSGKAETKAGKIIRVFGLIQDITDIKTAEKSLLESAGLTASLIEAMQEGVTILNGQHVQVSVNPAFCAMSGFTEHELIGHTPPFPYWPEEHIEEITELFNSEPEPGKVLSLTFKKKNGERFNVMVSPAKVYNEKGEFIAYFATVRDVTELHRQNLVLEELVKMTTQQNNRLLNFAQIVSHNIRSHASNIIGLLEIIRDSPSVQERELMLDMLGETGYKLDETIRNLNEVLTVNRNFNPPKELLNLKSEIRRIVSNFAIELGSNRASVNVDITGDLTIMVVPAYLNSIITNLISNSIKYRSTHRELVIRLEAAKYQAGVQLRVIDNGLGLDASRYRDQIFGMYRTFHGNDDARGLGLFLMKNQIEAMGGSIDVESEPDKGATFIVNFA